MNLKFNNGRFKIMQIADIQEDVPLNSDTIKLIDLAVEREKPDLVLLTGDQLQGYSACYLTQAHKKAEQCIDSFLKPITDRNIPFCFTFGNHDDDCKVSKAVQYGFYSKHPCFAAPLPEDMYDEGTCVLKIRSSDSLRDCFAIYLLDTGKITKNGTYAPVEEHRLDFIDKARERNGYLPAFVFQHIPCPEFYRVIKKVHPFKKGAVEGFRSHKGYYLLENPRKGEFMKETPACPEINTGEFKRLRTHGDILGIFAGHDHNNSFIRDCDGISLGYAQGAGFNTYGYGKNRGVRVYTLYEQDIRNYESHTLTMGELCSFTPSRPLKEFVLSHMPSSLDRALSVAGKAGAVLLGISAAAIALKVYKRK